MLKVLALADRYANIRGLKEARHDREEAQTHSVDIVAIVTALRDVAKFKGLFTTQFLVEPQLGIRVLRILADFFRNASAPGLIVYTEYLAANLPADRANTEFLRRETDLARRIVAQIFPVPEFFASAFAIDDSTEFEKKAPFVEEYLSTLETARIAVTDDHALQSLPSGAFNGAYPSASTFVMNASEPLQKVSDAERQLLRAYLQWKVEALRSNARLVQKLPHTLKLKALHEPNKT
jgi:hypothetical protein